MSGNPPFKVSEPAPDDAAGWPNSGSATRAAVRGARSVPQPRTRLPAGP